MATFGASRIMPEASVDNVSRSLLTPGSMGYVVRKTRDGRGIDAMSWDVLGGQAAWPTTNVRDLRLPQWRRLVERPEQRCLVPLTAIGGLAMPSANPSGGNKLVQKEVWYAVEDQPIFAVAGFWKGIGEGRRGFAMVMCDPNPLVTAAFPKAMVTILPQEQQELWLCGSYGDIIGLQRPYAAASMSECRPTEGPGGGTGKASAKLR